MVFLVVCGKVQSFPQILGYVLKGAQLLWHDQQRSSSPQTDTENKPLASTGGGGKEAVTSPGDVGPVLAVQRDGGKGCPSLMWGGSLGVMSSLASGEEAVEGLS